MRRRTCFPKWLVALCSIALSAPGLVREPATYAPVSRDMCTTPAGWVRPFTHVYRLRKGATVVFVGVEHTDDPNDDTHRLLKATFERYKPTLALIEGISSTKSAFDWYRQDIADLAKQRTDDGVVSENLYAVTLALSDGAQFSGWDFSPDQDYKVLVDDGFAIDDALGAHLLRAKVNPFEGEATARNVARQIRYATTVRPAAGFDYAAWYRRAYGDHYDPTNGTPCGSGIGSRIVSDLSYRRNLNLTSLIEARATPEQTIIVEAGANHWLALKDWLSTRSTSID